MALNSSKIIDAIPGAHRNRFVTASQIRQLAQLPKALTISNFDSNFQENLIKKAIEKNVKYLEIGDKSLRFMPEMLRPRDTKSMYVTAATKLLDFQQIILEMNNRYKDEDFVPLPRTDMIPFTHAILKDGDPRLNKKPLFSSPADFLDAFDKGLSMWAEGENGFGTVALNDVAGGAGARAARELARYPYYAQKYNVSDKTPRALYPIIDTASTFRGRIMDIFKMFSDHLGVRTPLFTMVTSEKAPYFVDHILKHPEAKTWTDDVVFWNQRVVKRYDLEAFPEELEEDFPAGHGDAAILGYRYGMYEAMKNLGVKHVANANGDEFLWYYMYPALLGKMNELEATMFMLSVPNANNQMGGFFGNGLQIEVPCIPYSYVATGKAPDVLNTTFTGVELETIFKGAQLLEQEKENVTVVVKGTWWNVGGKPKLMNIIGHDAWMGELFSRQNKLGGGKMAVFEAPRNLFLGIKGPQHAFDTAPQDFLGGQLGYGNFYTMMAEKSIKVLEVLLKGDRFKGEKQAKANLAEQLFKNNFELINVEI
jgi:hypothetical protein